MNMDPFQGYGDRQVNMLSVQVWAYVTERYKKNGFDTHLSLHEHLNALWRDLHLKKFKLGVQ